MFSWKDQLALQWYFFTFDQENWNAKIFFVIYTLNEILSFSKTETVQLKNYNITWTNLRKKRSLQSRTPNERTQ